MKEIALSSGGHIAIVDDADYEVASRHKWCPHKARQKGGKVYAYAKIGGRSVSLHRFLMGAKIGQIVDHADGDSLNNTRENLRFADLALNGANTVRVGGVSGFIGVFPSRKKWRAVVGSRATRIEVGLFPDPVEAARARDAAALAVYGDFAVLNFPNRGTEA